MDGSKNNESSWDYWWCHKIAAVKRARQCYFRTFEQVTGGRVFVMHERLKWGPMIGGQGGYDNLSGGVS
jgi:hypothetical protein